MRKLVWLFVVMALAGSQAAMGQAPTVHPTILVSQVYAGGSLGPNVSWMGYAGSDGDVIGVVPGILSIVPGHADLNGDGTLQPTNEIWRNFVAAAGAGVNYTVTNVVLRKQTPTVVQCADVFPARVVSQQGTANVRLWWPLMYELPGTTWTLTIQYSTPTPFEDPGNPGSPATAHQEVWVWMTVADLGTLEGLLTLFHELPFGLDEVPLISDEVLYPELVARIRTIAVLVAGGQTIEASLQLGEFEMLVADAMILVSPAMPRPTGAGTGIALTWENPVLCTLLATTEYVGVALGLFPGG